MAFDLSTAAPVESNGKFDLSTAAPVHPEEKAQPDSYAGDVASNIVPSASNYVGNLITAVRHPLDTGKSLLDVGAGALQNALPEWVVQAVGEDKPSREKADAAGKYFVDRYGSLDAAKEAFRTDPVGVMGDLSTVLGGVAGGAKLANPAAYAKYGAPLSVAADVTNPLNVAGKVAGKTLSAVSKVPTSLLGDITTGAGSQALQTAFDATKKGGQAATDFWDAYRQNAPFDQVVDAARQGISNMRKSMVDEYRLSKNNPNAKFGFAPKSTLGWADDTTPLSFQGIDDAFTKALNKYSFKGVAKPGVEAVAGDVRGLLDAWKTKAASDPSFLTVEGLDQLKQHLNDIYPADLGNRAGRAFAGDVVREVKNTIMNQVPQYKQAMLQYWKKSDQLDEISRELSLGEKSTSSTALRKLQSIMRNNANTSWGHRADMADTLAKEGGVDIMPSLAGQSLSAWYPRGLKPIMSDVGIIGGASLAGLPAAGTALLTTSPKLMGGLYALAGTGARYAGKIPYNPTALNALAIMQGAK